MLNKRHDAENSFYIYYDSLTAHSLALGNNCLNRHSRPISPFISPVFLVFRHGNTNSFSHNGQETGMSVLIPSMATVKLWSWLIALILERSLARPWPLGC